MSHFEPALRTSRIMLALLLSALAGSAFAQARPAIWRPDRPVTVVVPYAAGGGTDATARAISRSLANLWGQPVTVENLPGADGVIGTRKVIDSKPDGHTLVMQVAGTALTKYLPAMNGYDPFAYLEPVTNVADPATAFVATAKVAQKTLPDLIKHCKAVAATAPCSFGTGENNAKLQGKKLASETGMANLIIVNYKGTSAIIPDLIAGNVTLAYLGITSAVAHHKNGTVRILAMLHPERIAMLPDVPTTKEEGLPSFDSAAWYGLFAPKGTPREVTEGIAAAAREAGKDADVLRTIAASGAVPVLNTPAEFGRQVRATEARFADLVKRFPIE